MSLRGLVALYALGGIACAVQSWRTAETRGPSAVLSALAMVLVWPLWAPFVLDRRS
jgi:hypothetical protein